jgi:predicted metalloprotease
MQFEDGSGSRNVEDRRGQRMGFGGMGMGGGSLRGLSLGGLLVLLVLGYLFKGDPLGLIDPGPTDDGGFAAPAAPGAQPTDEAGKFASNVLRDTEVTWQQLFEQSGRQYEEATLVLFSDGVSSACGTTSSAVGPFYCPRDRKVYIDLDFYRELDRRFGAPGDFAQAYVIAHEVGHHVQNLLGIFDQAAQLRSSGVSANAVSVQQELQADCLAGVWGHYAAQRGRLEPGDLNEGLGAAAAIGDDRLQRMSRGQVSPESFTHGSSADRVRWFKTGFDTGQIRACDSVGR